MDSSKVNIKRPARAAGTSKDLNRVLYADRAVASLRHCARQMTGVQRCRV